jgi:putative ABC transport system permease protein
MRFADLLQSASESIVRNKSRSLLTVLGIVIGIAAVILMLSIGQGAQEYILSQVSDLGSDLVFVEPGTGDAEGGPPSPFIDQSVTMDDVEALRASGAFSFVSAMLISTAAVETEEESVYVEVSGVDEFQIEVFPAEIVAGRYVDTADVESYARVAVLGSDLAEDLFGDQNPVGGRVRLKGVSLRVVGVLGEQGTKFFSNLDQRLYLPVSTMQRDVMGVDYVNYISARAIGDVDAAKDEARVILRDAHRLDNPEQDLSKDDFLVSSQSDAEEIVGAVGFALSLMLASIAAISLVVGGIGIMNTMLMSVTERTREIGLRKAIGATERDVLRQFLLEAVLLTASGGILGILLGIVGAFLVARGASYAVDGWSLVIPPAAVALSAAVSTMVGMAFGYYPARRAARLDPIDTLRYE